jgi:ornithine decarboxylase
MHPVKTRSAIAEAYKVHGVRVFSLDTQEELEKIVAATADEAGNPATDLSLCVRLRVSSDYSELSLAAKFGVDLADAAPLLQATRQVADALGICFHVGSQAMTPFAYVQAMERVRAAIVDASVTVDIVDVGGGFPSVYPGMEPPPLEDYFGVIHRAFESLPVSYSSELWCEPGRALCAEYNSMIVRVEKRRGDELYINDGAYGALYDAAHVGWRFPVRCLSEGRGEGEEGFSFYGPTCDDADFMEGPFMLPAGIKAGDYIEVGMLGAYGAAMKTAFNGFGSATVIEASDEPMASLYRGDRSDPRQSDNVVSLR